MPKLIGWWCPNPENASQYCREHFPEDQTILLKEADRICKNVFLFDGRWELESTVEPVAFGDKIDWAYMPGDDPEWIYALNRHMFLITLAMAYRVTGKMTYANQFVHLLTDWLEHMPNTDTHASQTWRALETGLRCKHWLRALNLLYDCPIITPELQVRITESLRIHAEHLITNSGDFQILSNWGVIQDHGLYLAGLYLDDEAYMALALERLMREMHIQIFADGTHWEQSPQYHCEVLRCVLDVMLAAKRTGRELPESICNAAHKMARMLAFWCKPDGRLVSQSDSDEIDARDLVSVAAWLFSDGELKALGYREADWDTVWMIGAEGAQEYRELPAKTPLDCSVAFTDSGNYILRDHPNESAHYLHIHCGCIGSGHGHADLLHIDLAAYGEDILVDPGRYTYVDTPLRRQLKMPEAHNTVRVDDKDFTVSSGTWSYSRSALPVKGEFCSTEKYGFVSGGHLGYLDLPTGGVFASRKVVYLKPDLYLICDTFPGTGMHYFTQYFHFNSRGKVDLLKNGAIYHGKKVTARVRTLMPDAVSHLIEAPVSRRYNLLEHTSCLAVDSHVEAGSSLLTAICTCPAGEDADFSAQIIPVCPAGSEKTVPFQQAFGVELSHREKTYTVLFCHGEKGEESALLQVGAYKGYGKVVIFTSDTLWGEVLQW